MAKKTTIKKQKVGPKPKNPNDKKRAVFFMAKVGDIKLVGEARAKIIAADAIHDEAKRLKLTNEQNQPK